VEVPEQEDGVELQINEVDQMTFSPPGICTFFIVLSERKAKTRFVWMPIDDQDFFHSTRIFFCGDFLLHSCPNDLQN
jgi:hypothetical protein